MVLAITGRYQMYSRTSLDRGVSACDQQTYLCFTPELRISETKNTTADYLNKVELLVVGLAYYAKLGSRSSRKLAAGGGAQVNVKYRKDAVPVERNPSNLNSIGGLTVTVVPQLPESHNEYPSYRL